MIIRKSQIRVDESNLKNGRGVVKREFIVEGENLRNKAKLFSKITIPKGNSIGMHDHVDDFEIYYILSGKGKVLDNGQEVEVSEGDAIYTADGADFNRIQDFIENVVIAGQDSHKEACEKVFKKYLDYYTDLGKLASESIYDEFLKEFEVSK